MTGGTFKRYWPWWVLLGWAIGYELFAVATHRHTLSEEVWQAQGRFPALAWIVVPFVAVLLWHFFGGLWRPRR